MVSWNTANKRTPSLLIGTSLLPEHSDHVNMYQNVAFLVSAQTAHLFFNWLTKSMIAGHCHVLQKHCQWSLHQNTQVPGLNSLRLMKFEDANTPKKMRRILNVESLGQTYGSWDLHTSYSWASAWAVLLLDVLLPIALHDVFRLLARSPTTWLFFSDGKRKFPLH